MKSRQARIVRRGKKKVPWTAHLITDAKVALDLNLADQVRTATPHGSLCTSCKGARHLCGKSQCPIVSRIYSYLRVKARVERDVINGSSPPGVFVGRVGYPYVNVGPLVPPEHGDTSLLDLPEKWFGKSLNEILDFRFALVRGKHRVNVKDLTRRDRILEDTRLLALSQNSPDVELALRRKPAPLFVMNDEVQPIGPSATLRKMYVGNTRLDPRLEAAYYDVDLKAADAILELYRKGTYVSKLQRALSAGAFGVEDNRRLVPTRWSITAVDSILSLALMNKVKSYPLINEFRVYESTYLDNRFEVILLPDGWKYEAIEAWYPGTIWNPASRDIFLFGDWEGYRGRTKYARIGGCYYAARLAVCELLEKERRQATAIVLREAHPDYIMPVGVWQVRENVRNALRQDPIKLDSLEAVLTRIAQRFDIDVQTWVHDSALLTGARRQRKLTDYSDP